MQSNHLILCRPLLFPPSIFPGIRVFSKESVLDIRWPSIGVSASTSVLPMNIQDRFSLGWTVWISLHSKGLSRVSSNTTVQKHQFFGTQPSSQSSSHIHTWPLGHLGLKLHYCWIWASLVAQLVKNLLAIWKTWVQSLGWEDPLEKQKSTHSCILAWRIPWTVYSQWSCKDFSNFIFCLKYLFTLKYHWNLHKILLMKL